MRWHDEQSSHRELSNGASFKKIGALVRISCVIALCIRRLRTLVRNILARPSPVHSTLVRSHPTLAPGKQLGSLFTWPGLTPGRAGKSILLGLHRQVSHAGPGGQRCPVAAPPATMAQSLPVQLLTFVVALFVVFQAVSFLQPSLQPSGLQPRMRVRVRGSRHFFSNLKTKTSATPEAADTGSPAAGAKGTKDKGAKVKGAKVKGAKDKGAEDKGAKDKGAKDKGAKDKGAKAPAKEATTGGGFFASLKTKASATAEATDAAADDTSAAKDKGAKASEKEKGTTCRAACGSGSTACARPRASASASTPSRSRTTLSCSTRSRASPRTTPGA